jgi:hypothetical protein
VIALGNSSDGRIHANLKFSDRAPQVVDIAPFATEIVRLPSNSGEGPASNVQAVSIDYAGPSGSLISTGITSSNDGKFASMIRFYDKEKTVQANLYASNLRLRKVTPRMVLRNTSSDFITATPQFLLPDGTQLSAEDLGAISLAPHSAIEVDLTILMQQAARRPDLDSVSVQVANSGPAGSLIGALYSGNSRTGVTYDVPLRDSGGTRASTGGYPIRLDGDYSTIIYISNTTDKPGQFTMEIRHDGGRYVTGIINVAPNATQTLDLRKIRDEHKPDVNGRTLPSNLQTAQAIWSVRGAVRLNGRSEVVSIEDRVSSSYSCSLCCSNSFQNAVWVPDGATVDAEDDHQFTIWEQDYNGPYCGGMPEPYPISPYWWSDDESVATVDSSGLAHGETGGQTLIHADWPVYSYEWNEFDESCNRT